MAGSGSLPLPMRPQGLRGRIFGVLMERLNAGAYRRALDALAPKPGERLLEIGFGTGRFAELALVAAPDVTVAGVDPAETMVEVAKARRGVRAAGARADLRHGVDVPLPWSDDAFDAAVALHSFQFWPDPGRTLRELRRVLVPGGRLVIVLRDHARRAPDWLPNPISRSGDEAGGLRKLLGECGFEVESAGGESEVPIVARVTGQGGGGDHGRTG